MGLKGLSKVLRLEVKGLHNDCLNFSVHNSLYLKYSYISISLNLKMYSSVSFPINNKNNLMEFNGIWTVAAYLCGNVHGVVLSKA